MREIRLNGALGKKYGRRHRFDVSSTGEVFRALGANFPGFTRDMIDSSKRGVGYVVRVDGQVVKSPDPDEPFSHSMSITPVVTGSGPIAVFFKAAFMIAELYIGTTAATTLFVNVGAALVLSGVAKLLTPHPSKAKEAQKMEGSYFNGARQRTVQGGPVPLGYGEMIVGSFQLSAAITVEDKPPPVTAENVPIGGMFGNLSSGLMS